MGSTTWPPYSGDSVTCEKCGYDRAETRFVRVLCIDLYNGRHMWDRIPMGGIAHSEWEHLHRECLRCGWSWDEATVDSTKPPARPGGEAGRAGGA